MAKQFLARPGNNPQTKYGTKPREDVAMRCVEGDVVAEADTRRAARPSAWRGMLWRTRP